MNELLTAILRSDTDAVRHLLIHKPALASELTLNNELPIQVAKAKGHKEIEATFVRYTNWQESYSFAELKALLVDFISWLSEECFAASWLDKIEFELWELMNDSVAPASSVWERRGTWESVRDLQNLMNITQSWAMWDEATGSPVSVSLVQWHAIFDAEGGK